MKDRFGHATYDQLSGHFEQGGVAVPSHQPVETTPTLTSSQSPSFSPGHPGSRAARRRSGGQLVDGQRSALEPLDRPDAGHADQAKEAVVGAEHADKIRRLFGLAFALAVVVGDHVVHCRHRDVVAAVDQSLHLDDRVGRVDEFHVQPPGREQASRLRHHQRSRHPA